jgi:hypothetical protein
MEGNLRDRQPGIFDLCCCRRAEVAVNATVKEPTSYDAGLKDPQQRQRWIEGDKKWSATALSISKLTSVPYSEPEQAVKNTKCNTHTTNLEIQTKAKLNILRQF